MHEAIAEAWNREVAEGNEWQGRWEAVFASGFEKTDNEILTDAVAPEMVGSTAAVVVLSRCQIITSNCGDSRAVLCRGTQTIPLTVDQKVFRDPILTHSLLSVYTYMHLVMFALFMHCLCLFICLELCKLEDENISHVSPLKFKVYTCKQ